ncbi:hypothetical protein EVAR_53609_1 [Eumeta japonica]|uniref:Uncharacterized protein n=1 Tax=Eumeta variegata TaxID=151549 RepID=A0A4C1WYI9_EUMVA|nr:hypothetical protein EVAR_53609_1 [Eumeta japonica]
MHAFKEYRFKIVAFAIAFRSFTESSVGALPPPFVALLLLPYRSPSLDIPFMPRKTETNIEIKSETGIRTTLDTEDEGCNPTSMWAEPRPETGKKRFLTETPGYFDTTPYVSAIPKRHVHPNLSAMFSPAPRPRAVTVSLTAVSVETNTSLHSMEPLRAALCRCAVRGRLDGLFICSLCFLVIRKPLSSFILAAPSGAGGGPRGAGGRTTAAVHSLMSCAPAKNVFASTIRRMTRRSAINY